jgi:hypothetical protein
LSATPSGDADITIASNGNNASTFGAGDAGLQQMVSYNTGHPSSQDKGHRAGLGYGDDPSLADALTLIRDKQAGVGGS